MNDHYPDDCGEFYPTDEMMEELEKMKRLMPPNQKIEVKFSVEMAFVQIRDAVFQPEEKEWVELKILNISKVESDIDGQVKTAIEFVLNQKAIDSGTIMGVGIPVSFLLRKKETK